VSLVVSMMSAATSLYFSLALNEQEDKEVPLMVSGKSIDR
jgi:hypothetical protein